MVIGATIAPTGLAERAPTPRQRAALTLALPSSIRSDPVGCVWLSIAVSNNGKYAIVAPVFLDATRMPCLRYASNGYWLLKRSPVKWVIVFNGSDPPPCSLRVPRDLVSSCLR